MKVLVDFIFIRISTGVAALVLFVATSGVSIEVYAEGGSVGGGGGPLRELFEDAREEAAWRLTLLDECALVFVPSITPEAAKWILNNRWRLKRDVLASPHVWNDSTDGDTCAWTKFDENSPITLYTRTCRREYFGLREATRTLIHESVHHLGFRDETFPTAVAKAVFEADPMRCGLETVALKLYAPFEKGVCVGLFLDQAQAREMVAGTSRGLRTEPILALHNVANAGEIYPKLDWISNASLAFAPVARQVGPHSSALGSKVKPVFASTKMKVGAYLVSDVDSVSPDESGSVSLRLSLYCEGKVHSVDCGPISGQVLKCPRFPQDDQCQSVATDSVEFSARLTRGCLELRSKEIFDPAEELFTQYGARIWLQ